MSKKLSKIISITSTVLIVLIMVCAAVVIFLFNNSKNNDKVPSVFGYTVYAIQTDSMKDTINPGDLIVGKKCNPDDLKEGDIISFNTIDLKTKKPIINTHRIVEIDDSGSSRKFITKGDHEDQKDSLPVYETDVLSRYVKVRIPIAGYILTFLGGQLGFFLCIVMPMLLYTIWEVYKLIKVVMHNQKVKMINEVNDETSDEIKEAIIAQYLASQKEKEESEEKEEK